MVKVDETNRLKQQVMKLGESETYPVRTLQTQCGNATNRFSESYRTWGDHQVKGEQGTTSWTGLQTGYSDLLNQNNSRLSKAITTKEI